MNKNLRMLSGIVLCILFIYGCEKEHITIQSQSAAISFSKDIVPIFNNKCIGCHFNGGTVSPDLATEPYQSLISGGYINTSSPASSKLYLKLTDPQSDHTGRTSLTEESEILSWIQQGASGN